jgi:hypothetical protein
MFHHFAFGKRLLSLPMLQHLARLLKAGFLALRSLIES